MFGKNPSTSGILTLEGNTIEYSIEDGIITLTITASDGTQTVIQLPIGDFLSSGCAVLSENNDLVLTKKIQPSTILEIQSDELFEMPGAKQQPVVAVYPNSFKDLTGQRKSILLPYLVQP